MKKLLFSLFIFLIWVSPVKAIVDPLAVPNNRIGVHILEPAEITEAAKLVNSNGGQWGYVTIPMRSNDRDVYKWVTFFNQARELHVIPIIRIATYPVNDIWETPTPYDLVDFANFLNDMPWPTKNRYVILFNEPNHAAEWGGQVDPWGYANLLVEANQIFKSRNEDFYLLSAGLDMSAPNSDSSMDAFEFYRRMSVLQPVWYQAIDGLAAHAYPNPAFSASPYSTGRYGITSFRYEEDYLNRFNFSGKPIFITETGTVTTGNFYTPAFNSVWSDPNIVAITPFLLFASGGAFQNFSLLQVNHQPSNNYQEIARLPKNSGSPLLNTDISLSPVVTDISTTNTVTNTAPSLISWITNIFRPNTVGHSLQIKDTTISVEIADNPVSQAKGLSDRKNLAEDAGMLFKFPVAAAYPFWMKDMNFALDFVWISDNRVVELTPNVPPPSQTNNQPEIITPRESIDDVLEVNAGFIAAHNIQLGDMVNLIQ